MSGSFHFAGDVRSGVIAIVIISNLLVSAAFASAQTGPDLQITSLSNPPATAIAGEYFSVTDTTANTGTATAGSSWWPFTTYRLSLDATITSADPLLGSRVVPALAAGASSSGTMNVMIPVGLASGTYYVGACADGNNVVAEVNETNNCRVSTATIQVTGPGPDLVVSALSNPPATAVTGGSFNVTDTTTNLGPSPAVASTTRYLISKDATISTSIDPSIWGNRAVPALAAGASSSGTVTVTIPAGLAAGTYYLGACADYGRRVGEVNESNNCRASTTTIQVTGTQGTGPDLVVSALSNPPATVVVGGSFSVTDTTANAGTASAGASTTSYRLSLDATITSADPLLTGSRSIPSLAAGTYSSGTATVTIPAGLAAGTYYLGACADDPQALAEINEVNNCQASTTQIVVTAAPAISSVSPASGPVGTSVTIAGVNFGATQGSSTVTFNGTAATPTSWSATSIVVPVPAGATTGPVVVTVGGVASNGVTFTVAAADLQVTGLSDPPARAVVGGSFSVTETTANTGTGPAGASTTSYRLSLDAAITGADPLLGSRVVPSLGAGESSSGTVIVTVPTSLAAGSYFLGACADETALVAEISETNNCRASAASVTVSPPPAISSLSSTSGLIGASVTITGANFGATQGDSVVTFNGTAATPSSWSDTSIVAPVPNGATTGPVVVTVSGVASNGVAFTVMLIPDLQVLSLSDPPRTANPGESFTVTETTANTGTASAGPSTTRYRLSLDTTFTGADPLLGSRAVPGLDAGASSTATVTLTVPTGLAPGSYFLGACADDLGEVVESNEANNCRVAGTATLLASARDKGLAWLIANQNNDGSWKNTSGTEFAATATALEALGAAGLTSYPYAQAVSWLSNAGAISVDSLARQVLALTQAQVNATPYLQTLLNWRNTALAWGAYDHYETSFPDTPLALSAILKAQYAYSDTEWLNGLCGILTAQKTGSDVTVAGSWSYIKSISTSPASAIVSAILPTAYNVLEVNEIKTAKGWTTVTCSGGSYPLTTRINNGINWLLTQRRNPDGGFGDSGVSTVLETAVVYQAFKTLRPTDPATTAALDYLLVRQNSDGSWNGDAFQTALVVKALPGAPLTDADRDGIPGTIEIIFGTDPNAPDSRWLANPGQGGFIIGPPPSNTDTLAVTSVVPASVVADGVTTARVTVALTNSGNGQPGRTVTFTTTAGTFTTGGTTTTAVTDANGDAFVDLRSQASKTTLFAAVTASSPGSTSASATVPFTGIAIPEVGYLSATAGNGTMTLNWANPSQHFTGVLLTRKSGSPPTGAPADGVSYGVGDPVGDATVVYTGTGTGFIDPGLLNGADYFYQAYVYYGANPLYSAGTALDLRPSAGSQGQPIWSYGLAGSSLINAPTLDSAGRLYQSAGTNRLVGVRQSDGIQLWPPVETQGVAGEVASAPVSGSGGSVSALLAGDQTGQLYAVDAATGASLWGPIPLPQAEVITAPPAVQLWDESDAAYQAQYGPDITDLAFVISNNPSSALNNWVYAVRLSDGGILWQFNDDDSSLMDGSLGGALIDSSRNRLYVVTRASETGSQPSLWTLDSLTGSLIGSLSLGHIESAPLLSADGLTLYLGTTAGALEAIDVSGAAPVRKWSGPLALSGALSGPPREDPVTPGLLYFATTDGFVWALQDPGAGPPPDPANPVWKVAIPGPSAPLLLDGSLFVGSSDGRLSQLRLTDGLQIGQVVVGDGSAAVGAPSAVDLLSVYAGTGNGKLFHYSLPLP